MKWTMLFLALTLLGCGAKHQAIESPTTEHGFDVGSGGDVDAGEFVESGHQVEGFLRYHPIPEVTADAFAGAIARTKVISLETLTRKQKPIDALNYPDAQPPRIEVNRTAWRRLDARQRFKLAFHEYLGILRIADKRYEVSRQAYEARVCERSPRVRTELERELGLPCDRISADDLRFVRELDLHATRLSELKPGDFDLLSELRSLDLSQNKLKSLPPYAFRDLGKLEKLLLNENSLEELSSYSFVGLDRLSLLVLSYNRIQKIAPNVFWALRPGLSSPQPKADPQIDLCYNPIEILAPEALRGYSSPEIKLDQVSLVEVASTAFVGLKPSSVVLRLDWSTGKIANEAFQPLGSAEYVELYINGGRFVPTRFYGYLQNVKWLNLNLDRPLSAEQLAAIKALPRLDRLQVTVTNEGP